MFHEIARNSSLAAGYAQSAFRPHFPDDAKPRTLGEAIDQALNQMVGDGGKKRDIETMVHLDICPGCFENARLAMQDALSAMNDAKAYLDGLKSEVVKEED